MAEGDFWNNLDSFVEQKNEKDNEKVGDWLKGVPDPKDEKSDAKSSTKTKTTAK